MKEYFDKNPESNPYLDRLVKEWTEHGKIIIAVDFDDTISPWKMTDFDFSKVIDILIKAKQTGAYIVIFSACSPERFDEIRNYCSSKGLEIDSINENPIPLPYGQHRKIYANIFIDDRAGLNESLNILEFAMYKIRGSKERPMYDF
jgi:thiol-disulfide isomerase/thioredoxin